MKLYEIKYRVIRKRCCGRTQSTALQVVQIEAEDPMDARRKIREKIPGVKPEYVTEVL